MKCPLVLAALALLPLAAQAEIFRCSEAGSVTYQEVPCATSAQGGVTKIPSSFPEANFAERNRLLQREAALDARLLERERIESAERIARMDLAAREREAQAARDAAAAAASQSYVPVYWGGYRPPHVIHHRHYQVRSGPPLR